MSNMKQETTSDHSSCPCSTFHIIVQEIGFVLVISGLPSKSAVDGREV